MASCPFSYTRGSVSVKEAESEMVSHFSMDVCGVFLRPLMCKLVT